MSHGKWQGAKWAAPGVTCVSCDSLVPVMLTRHGVARRLIPTANVDTATRAEPIQLVESMPIAVHASQEQYWSWWSVPTARMRACHV